MARTRENMRAAVYCRISSDREDHRKGIADQEKDCRELCEAERWEIVGPYIDNDASAADPNKRREQYERLVRDMERDAFDVIVVSATDRLWRQPLEQEEFIRTCERLGMTRVTSLRRDYDLSTDDVDMLRIEGVFAAGEVRRTQRRIKRRMLQKAEAGEFHGGPRPFGYGQPPIDDSDEAKRASIATYNEINEAEATLLKLAAEKILDGGSLRSIAKDWRARDIKSTRGGNITESMIARTLIKPRIAGLIEHKGEVLGKAQWPAILDEARWEQVKTILTDPSRKTMKANKDYILRGVLKCGRCGRMLTPDRNRYLCSSNLGCGRLSLSQRLYEGRILAMVVPMADSPELRNVIQAADAGDYAQAQALRVSIAEDRKTLQQIEDDHYIEKALDRPAFLRLSRSVNQQIEQKEAELLTFQNRSALGHLGRDVMSHWDSMDAEARRSIILSMVECIEVMPSESPGRTTRDMSRIKFVWRYEGIGAVLAGMHEKGESYRLFAVWPPTQQAS